MILDEKEYGDEYYIYAMALLEEQEAKEKEQQKEEATKILAARQGTVRCLSV